MSHTKLKHAPLREVIFELFWECSMDGAGIQTDEGFDLAQGIFSEKLKGELPFYKNLIPENAPLKPFGVPIHQYWKGQMQWPVVQHGQGMIAINEVEQGYEWEHAFRPLIVSTLDKLVGSYKRPLTFIKCRLQYIDAWDVADQSPLDFVKENLQTELATRYEQPGTLNGFNLQLNFQLEQQAQMSLNITNGLNNQTGLPSVLWTTLVEKNARMKKEVVVEWIETAHWYTSDMFKKMLKPEFYASLDQ